MKLAAIVALLVIPLVQPQVFTRQAPEASLIVKVENGWFNHLVDAYVEVTIGPRTQATTAVICKRDPIWNQSFLFNNPTSSFMIVKVWNQAKRGARGGAELMGVCAIKVEARALNRSAKCDIRDGSVNLKYSC